MDAGHGDGLAASERKRQEALECIERARRAQADGDLELAQTEVTNAWYRLDEALSICPSNHRARFLLVSCAMNADDYQKAKAEAARIYQDLSKDQLAQMNDSVLHLSIAHASKMLGETDDAIHFALEATKLYPDDPQPYMVLGELYEANGQNHEAEEKCRQTLMHNDGPGCRHPLNPQNVFFTLCCLGSSLIKQGKFSEAEMFIMRAIKLDSQSTLAFRHLVDVYHFQGRLQEAMQVAAKIQDMDPEDEEIRQKMEIMRSQSPRGDGPGDDFTEGSQSVRSARSIPRKPPGASAADEAKRGRGSYGEHPDSERVAASKGEERGRSSTQPANKPRVTHDDEDIVSARQDTHRSRRSSQTKPPDNSGEQSGLDYLFFCCFDRDSTSAQKP